MIYWMNGMIVWINFSVLVASTIIFTYFYLASVRTGELERKMGERAYRISTVNRIVSALFLALAVANYVIYIFYPLRIPELTRFPWPYLVSALAGGILAIPSIYLLGRGMIDAGKGSLIVSKDQKPYGGIYNSIRHPQAAGELICWFVLAFFFNSPFLAIYSVVWIPIIIWISLAEEKDLIIRYGDSYREYMELTGFFLPKWRGREV
ncbi:hypothetical protein CEE36_04745 [candidate division TA06 bacterium B3_TA06]|uniref:Isoprenylcysteine carboxylmethyltransferase family protein n=1 Tax=candidate division TA06 bacterium B3_TA06 TaxID=2012487 RepID=A0A532V809_UNCT6|nr:MAG: hypothetical protein CEE36_04745 [candidate division TA06 bacterium B3_TA06]